MEEGKDFLYQLRELAPDCTAIFSITDLVAIGALVACKELGISVPEQMAVCGFSNNQMSSIIQPSLSSVVQPSLEMGKKAAHLLLKEILANKEDVEFLPETITLKTHLVIRQSSNHLIPHTHIN